jgi:hypothetical protein
MKRELACVETFSEFPRNRQQGIFNGPGRYHPSRAAKVAVLEDYGRVLPLIMPKDEAFTASMLWHNDLHSDNIFVDESRPTEITGIIDWQAVNLYPAFLHAHYPSLIEYDGPKLNALERPQLPPNFEELDPVAKANARSLQVAQIIWTFYQIGIQREAPDLLRVLSSRDVLTIQIMGLIGSTYDDGEPHVQSLLSELARSEIWEQVVGKDIPCPLAYSQDQLSKQRDELAKWERDIERKGRVLEEVGAYTGWNGAVGPEEYDIMSERLEKVKERFVDAESTPPEEREQWEKAWPFKDG